MKKNQVVYLLLIFILLLGFLFLRQIDRIVKRKAIHLIETSCHTCKIDIQDLSLSLLRTRVILEKVHFQSGDRRDTSYEFSISKIYLHFSPKHLLKKLIYLDEVVVYSPVVEIIEGDLNLPSKKSSELPSWLFSIKELNVVDGKFSYIRERPGSQAKIRLENIQVKTQELGNTPELRHQVAVAKIDAVLEKSGQVHINIHSPIFKKPTQAEVELYIRKLDLSQMNGYFSPNDQIMLQGNLLDGKSSVKIEGKHYYSTVEATYEKFDVKFKKGINRNGLEAFFTNIVASAKLKNENTDEPKAERKEKVTILRKSDESFLNAFFRSLKEAALHVAEQN